MSRHVAVGLVGAVVVMLAMVLVERMLHRGHRAVERTADRTQAVQESTSGRD